MKQFITTGLKRFMILLFFMFFGFISATMQRSIINAEAQITEVLKITPNNIQFKESFPQEKRIENLTIAFARPVSAPGRLTRVVKIMEQIKYKITTTATSASENLCPYISLLAEPDDQSLLPPITTFAEGTLTFRSDLSDQWNVLLSTPCFEGRCDEEYLALQATRKIGQPLDPRLQGGLFGCDLVIEVTDIKSRELKVKLPFTPFSVDFPFEVHFDLLDDFFNFRSANVRTI